GNSRTAAAGAEWRDLPGGELRQSSAVRRPASAHAGRRADGGVQRAGQRVQERSSQRQPQERIQLRSDRGAERPQGSRQARHRPQGRARLPGVGRRQGQQYLQRHDHRDRGAGAQQRQLARAWRKADRDQPGHRIHPLRRHGRPAHHQCRQLGAVHARGRRAHRIRGRRLHQRCAADGLVAARDDESVAVLKDNLVIVSRGLDKLFGSARKSALWLLLALLASTQVHAQTLRELADFAGVRDNALVGYGLVVGLDGSGDQTMQTPFTTQSLTNMFSRLGITVPAGTNMQLRNVAAVMVTATLPPFAAPGQHIDVVASSVGNAKSLRGGTLLMTPLKGVDGSTYAIAQGNLLVGGAGASAGGSSVQINQQAGGSISDGAIVERSVPLQLGQNGGALALQLKRADFGTAQRVVDAINNAMGRQVASAENARTIRVDGPQDSNQRVDFIARIQSLDVTPVDAPAR